MEQSRDFRFAVERTLGRLAKWLRILGFDTSFELDNGGQHYMEPDRIQLTRVRDKKNVNRSEKWLFIISDHYVEQLKQVLYTLKIKPFDIRPFSRCIRCNQQIETVHKTDIMGRVPDFIWETHDLFHICRKCDKIYWPGSHSKRSLKRIQRLFSD